MDHRPSTGYPSQTSRITRDPNRWHTRADRPYNLIEHLCRLITVSVHTVRTVDGWPPHCPQTTHAPPADLSKRPAVRVCLAGAWESVSQTITPPQTSNMGPPCCG